MKLNTIRILAASLCLAAIAMVTTPAQAQQDIVWERNQRTGALESVPTWLTGGNERGIAIGKHEGQTRLYVASRTGGSFIRVLDAYTGADIDAATSSFDMSSVTGGLFAVNDIGTTTDGKLVVGNMTTNASTAGFKVYVFEQSGGAPIASYTYTTAESRRLGDKISVFGSWTAGTLEVWSVHAANPGEVHKVKTADQGQNWTTEVVTLSAPTPANQTTVGSSSVTRAPNGDMFINGNGSLVKRFTAAGEYIANQNVGTVGSMSGVRYFEAGGTPYIAVYAYRELPAGTDPVLGYTKIFDITNPSSPVKVATSPKLASAASGNAISGDVEVLVHSDGTYTVYALGATQGLIAYGYKTIEATRHITGDAGWRMLSLPVSGVKVSDLASQNLIQGVPGSGLSEFEKNFFVGRSNDAWSYPASEEEELESGKGFIWYLYDNDEITESKPLPFTLNVTGIEPSEDVKVDVEENKWALLGNPFVSSLDVSEITANGTFAAVVQVWKDGEGAPAAGTASSETGSFVLSSDVELDGKIAPWQGFMLFSEDATEVTVPQSAKTTGGTFLKQQNAEVTQLQFQLHSVKDDNSSVLLDRAAILQFRSEGHLGWDRFDVPKLGSLNEESALMYFVAPSRNGDAMALAQASYPNAFDSRMEVPFEVYSYGVSGTFRIDWPAMVNMPEGVNMFIRDNHTNEVHPVTEGGSFEFTLATMSKSAQTKPGGSVELLSTSARFTFVTAPVGSTSLAGTDELPQQITLAQNFPNPFNPTTVIRYEIASSADVRLEVFDLMGRSVAVLVNQPMSAGSHSVTFDASALSSGVYVYRIESAGQILTRKMTLVK